MKTRKVEVVKPSSISPDEMKKEAEEYIEIKKMAKASKAPPKGSEVGVYEANFQLGIFIEQKMGSLMESLCGIQKNKEGNSTCHCSRSY